MARPSVLRPALRSSALLPADDEQTLASATQAFRVANWLHDWWYDSGFVEATGAAQQTNNGRGGKAGDPLVIQTQDGALRDLRGATNVRARPDV